MAQRSFSTNARDLYFLSSCASSPTQAIAESAPPWRPPGAAIGSSRLSSAMNCISSSSCRRDGSSSAPLRGSTDAEGWQRIGRISIARRSHSCTSLQSVSCSENFAIPHEVSGQTLIRVVAMPQPALRPDLIHRPGDGTSLREGWCRDPPETSELLLSCRGAAAAARLIRVESFGVEPHAMQDQPRACARAPPWPCFMPARLAIRIAQLLSARSP